MANGYKLYRKCDSCEGVGKRTRYIMGQAVEEDCSTCGGDGMIFFGWCTEDTFPMPDIE